MQASVTCALTGKLAFDEKDIEGKEGQEVFSERKGLNLLQQKVSCASLLNANCACMPPERRPAFVLTFILVRRMPAQSLDLLCCRRCG